MADDNSNASSGTSLPEEINSGVNALTAQAALKASGMDQSSPGADAFLAGYNTAQKAKSDSTKAGDTAAAVHEEYGGLSEEEKQAYKAGYASGAE